MPVHASSTSYSSKLCSQVWHKPCSTTHESCWRTPFWWVRCPSNGMAFVEKGSIPFHPLALPLSSAPLVQQHLDPCRDKGGRGKCSR